ncbi:MAG: YdbL family protein [Sedimenticola sp.]|nr:YdbL family protein [Sedimenticola sp.]
MNVIKLSSALAIMVFLAACVTINIYFPAAQAEEAAERIVDDILGKEQIEKQQKPAAEKKQGASLQRPRLQQLAGSLLNVLVPPAHAAQPDFNASSPEVRKLQASMKQRNSALAPHYSSGAVGFTRDALIAVRDGGAIPLRDKNRVEGLVRDENRDRNALYRAIAEANGHPEWEPEIRATFARTWVDKASSGWWYQNAGGQWVKK